MIKLWIENQELDTTEGFSHQITYAVDDLNNLDSKATSFSKTIILPGTANNNYLLGNIFEFANSNFTGLGENVGYNFNASRSAKCRLDINGLTIIKGVLRLLEIVRDGDSIEYEVAIFGELGGFVSKLSNKKLEDLDFSAYNHTYTVANIMNRWTINNDMVILGTGFDSVQTTYVNIRNLGDLGNIIYPGDQLEIYNIDIGVSVGTATVVSTEYSEEVNNIKVNVTNSTYYAVSNYRFKYTLVNKSGAGVYYPLIDYGNYSTNKIDYKYKTFRPALFVREYIYKIITGAGYTFESRFFNSDFFKRLIVPHNESVLQTIKSDLLKGKFQGSKTVTAYKNTTVNISPFSSYIITSLADLFTTSDNLEFNYTGNPLNLVIDSKIDVRFRHIIYLGGGYPPQIGAGGDFTFKIELYKNNVATGIKAELSDSLPVVARFGYQEKRITFTLSGILAINTSDDIKVVTQSTFKAKYNGWRFGSEDPGDYYIDFWNSENNYININSEFPTVLPIALNDTLELSRSIPKNIMQKDFFASIIKLFNLMVTEDKYKDRHLRIEPNVWFYNLNPSSYLDWSDKLDRSQPIKIKPMSEVNARYYDFKFKSDSDYYNDLYKKRYNEGYGDRKFDNELEFAKDSQASEVIFASTPLLGYVGKDKITPAIFKWNGGTVGTNEERVNSIIRIMQVKRIEGVDAWDILNDEGGVIYNNSTAYPYAGHFDDPDAPNSDLNFGATRELFFNLSAGALGNNLFNTYYSPYMAEITDKDSRLVTAKFKLNDTDIFNLDFRRFIWLDGVLYRLSRIVDYTPGEICTVELLRVIYTTYDSSINSADIPEISICGKVWAKKNLDTEYFINGDLIPQITDDTEWLNTTDPAWCYYDNDPANAEYGKLYNWYAVNDPRGLAPEGWKIPTSDDFNQLADSTCVDNDGKKIKEQGTDHWDSNNGSNDTNFTALGAGRRKDSGTFQELKEKTYFWTSIEVPSTQATVWKLDDAGNFSAMSENKKFGLSVRLIRDN